MADDQAVSLDETVTDPLSSAEREAVTKLREHDAVVASLKEDLDSLRKRASNGVTMAELRRLVEEADRVEGVLGLSREVLALDALKQAEWPAADLEQARRMLQAVTANEAATEATRSQLQADDEVGNVGMLCSTQRELLETWSSLRDIEAEITQRAELAVSRVDLGMEARATVISPLCAALLDKAATVFRKSKDNDESRKAGMAAFAQLKEESIRRVLDALDVELPGDIFDDGKSDSSPANTVDAKTPSALDAVEGKPTMPGDDFIASLAGIDGGDCTGQAAAAADAAASAVASAAAMLDGARDKESSQVVPKLKLDSPFAIGSGVSVAATEPKVDDPLLNTIPHMPSQVVTADRAAPTTQSAAGAATVANRGGQRYVAPSGSAELWHAVHVGDLASVQRVVESGGCDGATRDASGHSVLWHSIAFAHMGLATYMLDTFPPGSSEKSVEVTEIHQRKGDTLLHLICQSKAFGADTAHIFKRLAAATPDEIFQRVNHSGLTFLQIAASALNFWVLTFMLRNFPQQAKALICMPQQAPLRNMSEAISQPTAPTFTMPKPFPEHFHIAEMLQPDESGVVPYADVAFDVGPDEGGPAAGRFFAHRIVVASESPVLMEKLAKISLTKLEHENVQAAIVRVDARISKEVWRTALQFMYTGAINAPFQNDVQKVVELFRACVAYQLPQPLLDFAQSCLYPLLPVAPPQLALQVFSLCAGSTSEGMTVDAAREASTFIILRSAHKLLESMDANQACPILEKLVQSVEHQVFNPAAQKSPEGAAGAAPAGASAEPATQPAPMAAPPESMQATGYPMQGQAYAHWSQQGTDTLSQSMYGAPRVVSQTDMLSQSMRDYQQDLLSQSMREMRPDLLSQSMREMRPAPDMLSQSARSVGPDMLSQSQLLPSASQFSGQNPGVQRMQSAPQNWNMQRGYPQQQVPSYPGPQAMQAARYQPQQGQPMMQQPTRMQSVPTMQQPMMQSASFQPPAQAAHPMMQTASYQPPGSYQQLPQPNAGAQPMIYRGAQAQQQWR